MAIAAIGIMPSLAFLPWFNVKSHLGTGNKQGSSMLCSFARCTLAGVRTRRLLIPPNHKAMATNLTRNQGSNPQTASTDIVWMDLEMTGLDVRKDRILEISCLITDASLKVKSEGPSLVINWPVEVLNGMNEWCTKHHKESGLTEKVLKSTLQQDEAEKILLSYLQEHIPAKSCPLAGNSVYMDRAFLREWMPSVDDYLHYRIVDVSTIKELCRRWNPEVMRRAPKKLMQHRSLDDILESIEELKYYRDHFCKTNF